MSPSPEEINNAAAPSFKPEEFPAVTDPSFLNAGFNPAKLSMLVFARANSSF